MLWNHSHIQCNIDICIKLKNHRTSNLILIEMRTMEKFHSIFIRATVLTWWLNLFCMRQSRLRVTVVHYTFYKSTDKPFSFKTS